MNSSPHVYAAIVEKLFHSKYKHGMREIDFEREDIVKFARALRLDSPKNLGDLIYSFRYRVPLPESIRKLAGTGNNWIIRSAGRSRYKFVLVSHRPVIPNERMAETKVPDSTPGIVAKYALNDEQALLARVRYNRLVDVFTGVTCCSLQNHLRTTARNIGQVEIDELYIGIDKKGAHYVFPIQAKGGRDRLGIVQIEQDVAVCGEKFPSLLCRPIATQFMNDGVIAMFEFELGNGEPRIVAENHYRLVPFEDVSEQDLRLYKSRLTE
jgi:hypothetical protein